MSKNNRSNKNNDDDDVIEVSIIRSSDGCKRQFTIPSSSTLATLKTKINSDPNLGPIPHTQQRLFHLGRELKSSNRSLEALGIGKFNVFTVHLHAIVLGTITQVAAPSNNQCVELLESDDDEGVDGRVKGRNNNAAGSADVDVLDMTTTATAAAVERSNNRNRPTSNRRKHNQQQQQQQQQQNDNKAVVDLLDSDSDDDDVVEIIESSTSGGNKRRKRN